MAEKPASRIDLDGPHLRADQAGYILGDESVDGFADRPELDPEQRRIIAGWAQAFGRAIDATQADLLRLPAPVDAVAREILGAATTNADVDLPVAREFGLFERLSDEQLLLIREPWRALGGDRDYPLNVAEVAQLTGATPKQVRVWETAALVPGYRIDGRRQFFSAAVVHAFALGSLDRFQVAALAALRSSTENDLFTDLVEHALVARNRHRDDHRHGILNGAESILGQARALFIVASDDEVADAANWQERLSEVNLARFVFLHDAFADLAQNEDVSRSREAPERTAVEGTAFKFEPLRVQRCVSKDRFADIGITVRKAGPEWIVGTDLGVALTRKSDAVMFGKMLSQKVGDGAVRIYTEDDGQLVGKRRSTPKS